MAEMKGKVKPGGILVVILVVLGILFMVAKSQGLIGGRDNKAGGMSIASMFKAKPLKVCINTWPGYIPGIDYNGGMKAGSPNSKFKSEQGVDVEFVLNDDPTNSINAFKSGDVDVLWGTADAMPSVLGPLASLNPEIFLLVDKSRGGDVIIAKTGINTINDLKGKKVAYAYGSPSHSLLLSVLSAAGMTTADIQKVELSSAIDAAADFKNRKVDAAVIWSPDDQDILATMPGEAHVLTSTRDVPELIMDVFVARKADLEARKKDFSGFAQGWLKSSAMLSNSPGELNRAAKFAADALGAPFIAKSQYNAYFTTFGDNLNFFALNAGFNGTTGEKLYAVMSREYTSAGVIDKAVPIPQWGTVCYTGIVSNLDLQANGTQIAEQPKVFEAKTAAQVASTTRKFATKRVQVQFASGSSTLSAEMQNVLRREFGEVGASPANALANMRILIVGNTDNVGARAMNIDLSHARAASVASFFTNTYKFDHNRFTVDGKGPDNPVATNETEEGRAQNRRTDIEMVIE